MVESVARRKQRISEIVENRKARARESWQEKRDWAHAYFEYIAGFSERNRIVLTVGGTLASGGAAWAGFFGRERHHRQVEADLEKMYKKMESFDPIVIKGTAVAVVCGILYFVGFLHGRWHVTRRVMTVAEGRVAPTLVPTKGWGPFKKLRLYRDTDMPPTNPSSVDASSVPQKKNRVFRAMKRKDVKTIEEILKERYGAHVRHNYLAQTPGATRRIL
eukprot:CAMPEP_0113902892 /NCGR_PEP_ID=MMETSP0780_2-20120614/22139_1 /TAXON_ID=652834 /ORGANISM="Palpitomonas bilix" /LENGTH=217 /DNA_ID=CAMNT_0000895821 /DNA_START=264 /DNA_END=917 /DNA_ORIENTATION=- /assembly_acc=CAM_ASM_000599